MVRVHRDIAPTSRGRWTASPRSAASTAKRKQTVDADGHVVTPGLRRRPHAHGRAGVLGSDRFLLLLSRRDDGGDGQLRIHAGARANPKTPISCSAISNAPKTFARVDAHRHQVELGVVPAVPRHRRGPAERHQLRRLHGSLGVAHLRDGRTRVHRDGERRRSEEDVRADEGRAEGRRHRLFDVAHAQSHHRRRARPVASRVADWREVRAIVNAMGERRHLRNRR